MCVSVVVVWSDGSVTPVAKLPQCVVVAINASFFILSYCELDYFNLFFAHNRLHSQIGSVANL